MYTINSLVIQRSYQVSQITFLSAWCADAFSLWVRAGCLGSDQERAGMLWVHTHGQELIWLYFFNGRHTLETAARFLFQVSFSKAVQQLFWHLAHLAFNRVLTAPECLTDYVVELAFTGSLTGSNLRNISFGRDFWRSPQPALFSKQS